MRARSVITSARRRKRRMRARTYALWSAVVAAFAIIVFAGAGYVSHFSNFAISKIEISGTETVLPAAVLTTALEELSGTSALFFSERNRFLYPKDDLAAAVLENHPRIGDVSIEVVGETTLSIEVAERQPEVLWCSSPENCRLMDDEGVVFAKPEEGQEEFFTIIASSTDEVTSGMRPISADQFRRIQTIRRGIEEAGFTPTAFHRTLSGEGFFQTGGPDIRVPAAVSGQELVENLLTVVSVLPPEKELEYIDLRFGDHVPYYPQ